MADQKPSVYTNVAGTAAVTILAASGDALVYRDIVKLIISTPNAAAGTLTLIDGGGVTRAVVNYPNAALAPADPLVLDFPAPLQQSVPNSAWTLTASVNASGYNVTVEYQERQ